MSEACPDCGTALPSNGPCVRCSGTRIQTPNRERKGRPLREQDVTRIHPMLPGDVLESRWQIDGELARGPMSTLYTAHDRHSGDRVAVKALSAELCRAADFVDRFNRESTLMSRLSHPHLIPLLGVGFKGVVPFIVMPLLEGRSLSHRLRQEGPLNDAEALAFVRQIGHALAFLHKNELVHRDLKPSNIFVNSDGTMTLLDLGVAYDSKGPILTKPGYVLGTPEYMAPEQVAGHKVDARTDVYAFGVLLFELLTGELPFNEDNTRELMRAHKRKPPPDARSVSDRVAGPISAVINRALAKSPRDRFQTMDELVARLEMLLEDPTTAREVAPLRSQR